MPPYKKLRRNQVIRPFGPGAVLELEGQSFAVCSADTWAYTADWGRIEEPNLQHVLKKSFFAPPPELIDDHAPGYIPVARFPQWHFCPTCRRMQRVPGNSESVVCLFCRKVDLVPMRFILVCPHGHMGDVPWEKWVHRDGGCNSARSLRFYTSAATSGLDSVFVECTECRQRRSLQGIAATKGDARRQLGFRCSGRQPWQQELHAVRCELVPYVVQKGASNVHFAETQSSIDIPPHSSWRVTGLRQKVISHANFALAATLLANRIPLDNPLLCNAMQAIALSLEVAADDVRAVIANEAGGNAVPGDTPQNAGDLLRLEYRALTTPVVQPHPKDNFITQHFTDELHLGSEAVYEAAGPATAKVASPVRGLVARLVMVSKMRLVTAFKGFCRVGRETGAANAEVYDTYNGSTYPAQMQSATLGIGREWLPGVENFGEGLFFTLDLAALNRWETLPAVRQRYAGKGVPAFYLIHTLAHAFIRQCSFEAGYSLSSICERIYCAQETDGRTSVAGVLIYTASGDSEGSLGGLSRLARPDRFLPVFAQAIREVDVCSNDPLCRESSGQGLGSLNLAACHACLLLPETSCAHFNANLDRLSQTGDPGTRMQGFVEAYGGENNL